MKTEKLVHSDGSWTIYTKDAQGAELSRLQFDSQGQFEGLIVYEYDGQRSAGRIVYGSQGKVVRRFELLYDDTSATPTWTVEYDGEGREIDRHKSE